MDYTIICVSTYYSHLLDAYMTCYTIRKRGDDSKPWPRSPPQALEEYFNILYYAMLCYTILYYIIYYTILYYTIIYYTVLYCTVLYYTIMQCNVT